MHFKLSASGRKKLKISPPFLAVVFQFPRTDLAPIFILYMIMPFYSVLH